MKKNLLSKLSLFIMTVVCALTVFSTNVSAAVTYSNGKISNTESTVVGDVNVPMIANGLYGQLSVILNGFIGIALITLVLFFVIRCGQLGASADNAQKRSQSLGGLLWVGIAIGGLGFFSAAGGVFTIIVHMTKGSFLG